jgi:tRNA dimethylallyltransferase
MKKPLIILTGPTAVGKTELSIRLAESVNGEIISADSMQVYKHMDVGTAKITPEEMQGIRHHLIDILEPSEDFNVYLFKELAQKAIDEIYERGKIPVVTGGTGFYIQALLYNIEFEDTDADTEFRETMYRLAEEKGNEYVHDMLKEVDPVSAREIHYNNIKRVVRALEYHNQTGKRISEHNEEQKQNESPYNFLYFVLNDDRDELYSRINKRVDLMFETGLTKEVDRLIDMGCHRDMTSMKAIGYREFFDYYDGIADISQIRENIKTDTRHFAKRQLTWFRREKEVTMVNVNEFNRDKDKILDYMLKLIREKEII